MQQSWEWSGAANAAVAVMALVLITMMALNLRRGMPRRTQFTRYMGLLFFALFFYACAVLLEHLLAGRPGRTVRYLLYGACFCEYLFCLMLVFTGSGILLSFLDPRREKQTLRLHLWVLGGLGLVLLLAAQFTPMFYSFDGDNLYQRGPLYGLALLTPGLILGLDVWVLIRYGKQLTRNERNMFWTVVLVAAAAAALQSFLQNVVPLAAFLCSLMLYMFFAERQVSDFYRQQAENRALRTEIMLSQIQPHFLYNSLGAIAELCDTDPQKAKQTTLRFSRYFQGVMESLNSRRMVPFSQELAQTKLFLELEQVRFEDALEVEYRIGCSAFELPPMCLQPLAENAVQHGVRRNPDGRGRVVISSAELADCYEVTVTDDGPGLDNAPIPARTRPRVGVANVRERLRLICGGSLELSPGPERGVTATIRIPKTQTQAPNETGGKPC